MFTIFVSNDIFYTTGSDNTTYRFYMLKEIAMFDTDSRLPLYYQLMDVVVEKINNGELKEHDKLPSERAM